MGKHFLIVYAHPEPKSYTGSSKDIVVKALKSQGHSVEVSDLYAQKWNPVLSEDDFPGRDTTEPLRILATHKINSAKKNFAKDVLVEMDKLNKADYLIFICPYWWGSVPAMIKGWMDRVFACGFAWDFGGHWKTGKMRGKRAMIITSVSGSTETYSKKGAQGMDVETRLQHITWGSLAFCGFDVLPTFVSYSVPVTTDDDRKEQLQKLEAHMKDIEKVKLLYNLGN